MHLSTRDNPGHSGISFTNDFYMHYLIVFATWTLYFLESP
jgi:hypothetical protein